MNLLQSQSCWDDLVTYLYVLPDSVGLQGPLDAVRF